MGDRSAFLLEAPPQRLDDDPGRTIGVQGSGADAFARIRGYLSTLRKQGVALLTALDTVCAGRPLYPAFA